MVVCLEDCFMSAYRNSPCISRAAFRLGCQHGNGVLFLVVCDNSMHREQTGSDRLGAKELLHNGRDDRVRSWANLLGAKNNAQSS